MNDRLVHKWLRDWNTRFFLEDQRTVGRTMLKRSQIAQYSSDHDKAATLLEHATLPSEDVSVARMLRAVTAPLAALSSDSKPTYYSYTGINILDEYIDDALDLNTQKALCVVGLQGLIASVVQFETGSIIGTEPWSREHFVPDIALERLKVLNRQIVALKELAKNIAVDLDGDFSPPRFFTSLEQYCTNPLVAIIHFTCLPQTLYHDEVLFLRTIAEDELCFKGIYVATRQAIEALERKMLPEAVRFLNQATAFAAMLHESFRVLASMPPGHFADFRAATGNASAVQSLGYQRLEIALFGLNPQKVEVYKRVRHLRNLLQYSSGKFVSLKSLLDKGDSKDRSWDAVVESARALDRSLLSWRGLHLSFARRYLGAEANGTGGTAGPSYLEKYLRHSLFGDSLPDLQLIKDIFGETFGLEELFQVQPGMRIAPREQLWGS